MGIVFRQSAKTSIVVATGAILGALIIWLSTKYIPDKHQFGFIGNFTNNAVMIACLLIFGVNYTMPVYIHKFANNEVKRRVMLTLCLAVPAIMFVFFTAAYLVLRYWVLRHYQPEDMPLMSEYYGWLPVLILLFIYQQMLEQYLGTQMKQAVAAFMREVVVRVINIVLIFLFAADIISFHVFVVGTVLMNITTVLAFLLLSSRTKPFKFSTKLRAFQKDEYKELLHFSWYHFLLAVVIMLMSMMDMLLIPFYDHEGFGDLAIYRIAVYLISILQLPSKALLPASFTVIAKAFAENELPKARDFFLRSSVNLLIPTLGLGILLCCNLKNVAAVIAHGYEQIIPVFMILFVGRIIDLATGMNDQVLSIANYYKFNFYLSLILTAVLFVLIRLLVPWAGLKGAAWSTTITLVIFNVAKYVYVKRKLDMKPFSKDTLLIIICGLPALAAGYFFPYLFNPARHVYVHSFIDAGIRSAVIIAVYLGMLLWLKPSRDLREYIAIIKKEKRLF